MMGWMMKLEEGMALLREIRDTLKELLEEHRAARR